MGVSRGKAQGLGNVISEELSLRMNKLCKRSRSKVDLESVVEKTFTVDDIVKKIYRKIQPQWWAAFWGCMILGLLTYMYFMTNNFLTFDSLWNIYSDQDMISSGRQFLTYACGISSFYDLPWVNGLLAIIFLAMSSVVVVEGLGIKSRVGAILAGGLLVTFPAIASTFCYSFTIDGYMIAVFLSALAFLLTDRMKWGFLPGIVCLGVSIGIYQAYFSFTIVLCILRLLTDLIEQDDMKVIWNKIWRYPVMGIGGYIFYCVTLKCMLWLKNAELSGYQGTDKINSFSLADLPAGIIEALKSFARFALTSNVLTSTEIMKAAFIVIVLFAVALYIICFVDGKRYKSAARVVLALFLVIAIPIGATMVNVLSPGTFFHLLMRLPWALFFVYAIVLAEKITANGKKWYVLVKKGMSAAVLVCGAVLIWQFGIMANIVAFNMNERYEKTYAVCVRMVDRIEQTEGYTTGTKVALLGGVLDAEAYPDTDITKEDLVGYFGAGGTMCISDTGKFATFSKHYLNVTIETIPLEEEIKLTTTEEFANMPKFPEEGSVQFIGDVLVIKWNG